MRDRNDLVTPDLFPALPTRRQEARRVVVCRLLADMLHGRDRHAIASAMTERGSPATKPMIDAWASPRREGHNLPMYLAPGIEEACGDAHVLTDWLVSIRHGRASYGADATQAALDHELAELEMLRHETAVRINELRKTRGRIAHA